MSKAAVLAAIRDVLAEELAAQKETAAAALDEATSEESRPENQYDTRSLEASYLAGALAERLAMLRQLCAFFDTWQPADFTGDAPIAVGALVSLAEEDEEWLCLLVPRGGRKVSIASVACALTAQGQVGRPLTGSSPLGPSIAKVGTFIDSKD